MSKVCSTMKRIEVTPAEKCSCCGMQIKCAVYKSFCPGCDGEIQVTNNLHVTVSGHIGEENMADEEFDLRFHNHTCFLKWYESNKYSEWIKHIMAATNGLARSKLSVMTFMPFSDFEAISDNIAQLHT